MKRSEKVSSLLTVATILMLLIFTAVTFFVVREIVMYVKTAPSDLPEIIKGIRDFLSPPTGNRIKTK